MHRGNLIVLTALLVASSMAQSQPEPTASSPATFTLTSSAFASGDAIPGDYTCDGADQSPELGWSQPPAGTVTLALVMHDPDAPAGDWLHWIVWNIPANETGLTAKLSKEAELPNGTRQGNNDFRKLGYNGPCPPARKVHKYLFHLYAVDMKITLPAEASRADLDLALKGHVLAEAEYTGTYHR